MIEVVLFLVGAALGYGGKWLLDSMKAHAAQLEADAKAAAKQARAAKAAAKRRIKALKAAEDKQEAAAQPATDSSLYGRKNGAAGEVSWPAAQ